MPKPADGADASRELSQPANYWAIASVLCGIVGCLVFPPIAAIVFGSIGLKQSKRTGVGQGMAKAGLLFGVLWLVVYAIGGFGIVWIQHSGAMAIAKWHRAETVELINRLPGGRLDQFPNEYRIGQSRTKELAETVRALGTCQAVMVDSAAFTNRDDVFGVEFFGAAVFERGRRQLRVRMFFNGSGFGFSELDWQ